MFLNESSYITGGETSSRYAVSSTEFDMQGFLVESTEEWFTIREKMMKAEHVAIVSEDAQLLSEATDGFVSKVKAWFVKMWNAIKNFFKKAVSWLASFFTKSDQWVKKYEKQLMAVPADKLKGKKINKIQFDLAEIDALKKRVDSSVNPSRLVVGKDLDESDAVADAKIELAKQMFKGEESAADYKKDLFRDKEQVELSMTDVREAISVLKSAPKLKTGLERTRSAVDTQYKNIIRDVERFATSSNKDAGTKRLNGDDEGANASEKYGKEATALIELYRHVATLKNQACDILVAQIKASVSHSMAVCRKALAATPKKAMSESYSLFEDVNYTEEDAYSESVENVLDLF